MSTSLHYQRTGGSLLAQDPWGGEGGEGPTGVLVGSRSGDQASTVLPWEAFALRQAADTGFWLLL